METNKTTSPVDSSAKVDPVFDTKLSIFAIVFVLLIVFSLALGGGSSNQVVKAPQPEAPTILTIGDEGQLVSPSGNDLLVANTKEDFDSYITASAAKDKQGIFELLSQDRAYVVPNGTKILVLERDFGTTKIRILDGESAGMSGWVTMESLVK